MLGEIRSRLGENILVRFLYNRCRELKIILRDYSFSSPKGESCLIFMIDGKIRHGGLTDRLYGIMNAFAICKIKNMPFKLFFIFPFDIHNFLVPNNYNWTIEKNDISYNKRHTRVIVNIQEERLFKNIKINKQIHLYSNAQNLDKINKYYNCNYTYSTLFNELFKFSKSLQTRIDKIIDNDLKKPYTGLCFRFQNLLGDFVERNYKELPEYKKNELLELCRCSIIPFIRSEKNIVVTSDSLFFLKYLSTMFKNIYIIPGDVVHMDYIRNAPLDTYEKSFIDFFILGYADIIINFYGHGLRKSGFPVFASQISNSEFEAINIDSF
jgi:hypothetical protein